MQEANTRPIVCFLALLCDSKSASFQKYRELEFWFPAASRKPSSTGRTGAAPGDPEYKEMMLYMREQVSRLGVIHRWTNAPTEQVA